MTPPKQNPAAILAHRVRKFDQAGKQASPESTNTRNQWQRGVNSPQQDTDFALDLIRGASRDLKAIDQHVTTAGTALSQGRLSWRDAIKLVNYYAPGIIPVERLALLDGGSQ